MFLSAAAAIRAVQFKKQWSLMEMAGDRMSFVRTTQSQKAALPIDVTPSGMVMAVREEHSLKAARPIVVTVSGMVMAVREEHLQKTCSPIVVTPSGMVMAVREEQ
jgi:hypothetical protein